ncbi:thioredoxin-disulfide reductase [Candidatus Gromoviella agglomerans]|uniref:thioredoxin-disulfide reductase n=1 Tax=Candidatus Gromoviella agglomerans TaxID=2806609 RepID=UPI001E2CCDE9|nr:thioredoxin-disulfide reductase [Candidatus Gromoviella agglomerans]UFX98428.1 Thioredoxin reductase [Candidatus Gromoviella agglomerans]
MNKILVIGSGPAGCTAAIYCSRALLDTYMLIGDQPGGQLTITSEVENYPGFIDSIHGPILMQNMIEQSKKVGTKIIEGNATSIEKVGLKFQVHYEYAGEKNLNTFDAIIICTGAQAKHLGIESEKDYWGYGLSMCATCDGPFFRNKEILVVGGGNTAMEEALFLSNICKSITILHRRDSFRAEKIMINRVMEKQNINIMWNTELKTIHGDKKVTSATVFNNKTNIESKIQCDGIFVAIGHKPNTEIVKNLLELDSDGYIITNKSDLYKTMTSMPGIFAAGDVCDKTYRQAVTAAGMGCMAALNVQKYLDT